MSGNRPRRRRSRFDTLAGAYLVAFIVFVLTYLIAGLVQGSLGYVPERPVSAPISVVGKP